MNANEMVKATVGIVVALIAFSAILVPAINTAQETTADVVNYTNDSTLFKMANTSEIVTISLSSGTVTLNGETVEHTSNSNLVLSDVFSCDQLLYEGNWLTRAWYADSTALSYPSAFSLTFEDGTVTGTITRGGETVSVDGPYTYLYYADPDGTYCQKTGNVAIDAYVKSVKDVVLSGLYYTGDNDTTYSYIDGVLTLEGDYVGSIEFTSEKVGMDVLHLTGITVNVGDESFTPFRYLVPAEVVGHTSNDMTDLLGFIPVLITVGLIMGILGLIAVRRFE